MKRISIFTAVAVASFAASAEILLPDPTVFAKGGTYYLTGTGDDGENAFYLYRSPDMYSWSIGGADDAGAFALKVKNVFGEKFFWAPQIFARDDKLYLAYCTYGKRNGRSGHFIAVASSPNIDTPFSDYALFGEGAEIDPFVFFDSKGVAYMYYVDTSDGNRIFVRKLSLDLSSFSGNAIFRVGADSKWEKKPLQREYQRMKTRSEPYTASSVICEGPTVIERRGKYVLFYSANNYCSPDYCVGYAVSDSPTGSWEKACAPLLSREGVGFNGTGHGDVFFDSNGDMWYVFHVHNSNINVSPRRTATVKLEETFDKRGNPQYKADMATFRLL